MKVQELPVWIERLYLLLWGIPTSTLGVNAEQDVGKA